MYVRGEKHIIKLMYVVFVYVYMKKNLYLYPIHHSLVLIKHWLAVSVIQKL